MAAETTRAVVMRSELGRARGLGPAHAGAGHWLAERVTAAALVPLSVWFIVSVLARLGADQTSVAAWIAAPWNAALLLALLALGFHHLQLGMQVVYEDYIHAKWLQTCAILATRGAALLLALTGAVAVLKLTLNATSGAH